MTKDVMCAQYPHIRMHHHCVRAHDHLIPSHAHRRSIAKIPFLEYANEDWPNANVCSGTSKLIGCIHVCHQNLIAIVPKWIDLPARGKMKCVDVDQGSVEGWGEASIM